MTLENQNDSVLSNEETLEDVGGFIIKNANQKLWDGYDQQDDTNAESEVQSNVEPSSTDDVDLSIFDELDASPDAQNSEDKPEEAEQETPEFSKLADDFKKVLGVDLKEALDTFKELQNLRAELVVKEQERTIRNAWGVDDATYNQRMNEVRQYAQNIASKNPEMFKKLDNPEGVQLIWSKLEQSKATKQKQVPGIQSNSNKSVAQGKGAYDFTMSQLQKMSRDEYAKNSRAIERAFANSRVNMKA